MPRSASICAAAVQSAAQTAAAANVVPGTPITSAQQEAIWQAIINAMFQHDASNAVVAPGTFSNGGGAVAGLGGPIS